MVRNFASAQQFNSSLQMKREDDEALWDLLAKSPAVEPSPFFARNVLRSLREQESWTTRLMSGLKWQRLLPATAAAVLVIAVTMLTRTPSERAVSANNQDEVLRKVNAQDYEVVADLDDLLALDENSLWTEAPSL
jgi:hypothetical protein